MASASDPRSHRGRGATLSPDNRYSKTAHEAIDDGWGRLDAEPDPLHTTLAVDTSRSVISYNSSPDVGFDRSINPYRGCEHGCVYCFARPTHAWLGLSPGLDFESRILYKPDAPEILRQELAARGYSPAPVALGINTDGWQPVERKLQLTRRILQILVETGHPASIVTKSSLIERDIDLLGEAASRRLISVAVSITTLDRKLARIMEPRAAAPHRRLETVARLRDAGIPVSVLVAPVIPVLTDGEMESILEKAREAGAGAAGYILLRLPLELKDMFESWLRTHRPDMADHVLNRLRDTRRGNLYQSQFGERMRGTGDYANLLAKRFSIAEKRLGFAGFPELDCGQFRPPRLDGQMDMF